jgi:hypothetical protein
MQDVTGDAHDTLDEVLPFGAGNRAGRAEYLHDPRLTSIACFGDGAVTAGSTLGCTGSFGILHRGGLVVLQSDDRLRLGLHGNLEGFFWQ